MNRILLSVGFIPTGLKKVMGERFTLITTESPIGLFFDVFYQNELWYFFVGAAQMLAGILLLIPFTAHLGALLFLPIIANIFIITVGLGFKGTWVITMLMLLSNTFLVAWYWPRWRSLFVGNNASFDLNITFPKAEKWAYGLGVVGLTIAFTYIRFQFPPFVIFTGLGMMAIGALLWIYSMVDQYILKR